MILTYINSLYINGNGPMLTAIHVTLIIQYDVISTVDSNEPVRMHVFRICHKRPINFFDDVIIYEPIDDDVVFWTGFHWYIRVLLYIRSDF